MSQILTALSVWLHALATVILIGHYLLSSLVYIPALQNGNGTGLSEISKHSRPWLYTALVIFMVTGIYLTLIDSNYLGLGNFNNFWAVMMLIKHLLVVGMIGLGFWFNAILRVGPMMASNNSSDLGIRRFHLYSNLMAISGVLILLLTALAQVK